MYRIYSRSAAHPTWSPDDIGDPSANWFDTEADAIAMIEQLRDIGRRELAQGRGDGSDWLEAEYEVREENPEA